MVMVLRPDYRSWARLRPGFSCRSSARWFQYFSRPEEMYWQWVVRCLRFHMRPGVEGRELGKAEGRRQSWGRRNCRGREAAGAARLPPEGGVPAAVAAVPGGGREALICGTGVPNLSLLMNGGTRDKRPPLPGPLLLGRRGTWPAIGFRRRDADGCDRDGRAGGTACPAIASERRRKKRGSGWLRRSVRRLACHWRTLRNL